MLDGTLGTALFSALVLWIVYRRFARSFGRQRLRRGKLVFRILIYGALLALLTPLVLASNPVALGAAGVGVALACTSIRLTSFEHEPEGTYYTPNALIGAAVFSLFLGRLSYRLVGLARLEPESLAERMNGERSSPITLGILLLLVSYYACYYGALLLRSATGGRVNGAHEGL